MEVTIKRLDDCDILKVSGRVDGATSAILQESFRTITDEGRYRIVLDMSGISIISSDGLRLLVDVQRLCMRSGRGHLVLAAAPSHVDSALELAGFYTIFEAHDTLAQAVESV